MNENLPVVIYSPESALRNPSRLLGEMFRDLMASRELAWRLFVRDISARYRQTFLGYIWAFLPPVATTLTFVLLNRSGVFQVGETTLPYAAYVMIGTLLWQVFVDALQAPIRMVTASKAMLAKINFPREALLLAGVGEVLFNFAIRFVLLVGVFVWFKITPPLTVLLLPAGLLALIGFGFMIGILLTPIGLLWHDVGQGLILISGFWMFLTPVVYPPTKTGPMALLGTLNPVTPLIVTTRDWITTGHSTHLLGFLIIGGLTLLLLLIGWILYRLAMPILVERMGS